MANSMYDVDKYPRDSWSSTSLEVLARNLGLSLSSTPRT